MSTEVQEKPGRPSAEPKPVGRPEQTRQKMAVDRIRVDEDLYPRREVDPTKIEEYAEHWEEIDEPIRLAEFEGEYYLEDGRHRLEAASRNGCETVDAVIQARESWEEIYRAAIYRNVRHGLVLSREDKRRIARSRYPDMEVRELVELLQVPQSTVYRWVKEIKAKADAADGKAREESIIRLHRAGKRQREIAGELDIAVGTVNKTLKAFRDSHMGKTEQAWEDHQKGDSASSNTSSDKREPTEHREDSTAVEARGGSPTGYGETDPQNARAREAEEKEQEIKEKIKAVNAAGKEFQGLIRSGLPSRVRDAVGANIERLVQEARKAGIELAHSVPEGGGEEAE